MTLTEIPAEVLADARWRAALTVLCGAFADDAEVWARVVPGESCDLAALAASRPPADRMLLSLVCGLVDGTRGLRVDDLLAVSDRRLRVALDAVAIARGRELPVEWPQARRRGPALLVE